MLKEIESLEKQIESLEKEVKQAIRKIRKRRIVAFVVGFLAAFGIELALRYWGI